MIYKYTQTHKKKSKPQQKHRYQEKTAKVSSIEMIKSEYAKTMLTCLKKENTENKKHSSRALKKTTRNIKGKNINNAN